MFEKRKQNLNFISEGLRDYAHSMTKDSQFSAFIEFKTNFLSGNWDGKYGLIRFTDHNIERKNPLKYFIEIVINTQEESRTNIYNFPYPFIEEVKKIAENKKYLNNVDYIKSLPEGVSHGSFASVLLTHTNIIHESIDMSQWTEKKVGFTELSVTEYAEVMVKINSMPEEEKKYILDYHEKKSQKVAEMQIEYAFKATPCQERPFSISIDGNDDCSYIKLFETKEQAWACYKELTSNAMKEDGYELVHRLGFDFSG